MNQLRRKLMSLLLMAGLACPLVLPATAMAASAEDLNADARRALDSLFKHNPTAAAIGSKAPKGAFPFRLPLCHGAEIRCGA